MKTVRIQWNPPGFDHPAVTRLSECESKDFHTLTRKVMDGGRSKWSMLDSGNGRVGPELVATVKPDQYLALRALCREFGLSKFLRRVAVPKPPMSLQRWAGLRGAHVEKRYQMRDGGCGLRYVYRCIYNAPGDPGCWEDFHGPVRRNPIEAMKAAQEQDEKRRARKR